MPVAADRSTGEQPLRVLDRDAERQPLRDRRSHPHRGDPDHAAGAIEERAAAVARVDGRVGLHQRDPVDGAHGADDTARHRVLEAERRPERHDFLPRPRLHARTHWQRRLIRIGVADPDDCDIEFGGAGVDARRSCRAVRPANGDRRVGRDHVHVGENRVGRDEEAAAESAAGFNPDDGGHRAADDVLERRQRRGGCHRHRRHRDSVRAGHRIWRQRAGGRLGRRNIGNRISGCIGRRRRCRGRCHWSACDRDRLRRRIFVGLPLQYRVVDPQGRA